jgi:predicted nucleic acid-binding protein
MIVFLDTSVLVTVAFGQPDADQMQRALGQADMLVASSLLEAEFAAACRRESIPLIERALDGVRWIHPERSLLPEIRQVLEGGFVRGADCWHLATALYFAPDPGELLFLTQDRVQRQVAERLGFAT